jgi:hypothetical protein
VGSQGKWSIKMSDSAAKRAWIERVLGYRFTADIKPGARDGAAATGVAVTYAKSRLAWLAARQKIESEIGRLRSGLIAAVAGFGIESELHAEYTEFVAPVLAELDESLADKLDEAANTADTTRRSKLVDEARLIIQRYQGYVAGAPVIAALDTNPLMPLAIRQTLTDALTVLSKAVH